VVAHALAGKEASSILSADSMLVYRGMDVGTAKPTPAELKHFRYSGVNLVDSNEDFNLALYIKHARRSVEALNGMPLIVVGGTGLYVKTLTRGFDDAGMPNPALRRKAEEVLQKQGIEALREFVRVRAPCAYEDVKDKGNSRRLVRALESTGASRRSWGDHLSPRLVGLRLSRELLIKRIEERVDKMYESGLLDETRQLMTLSPLSRTARQAIGYKEAIAVLDGEMDWVTARERICVRTRRLAKSQMTWFRNQEQVDWVDVEDGMDVDTIAEQVEKLWRENGRTRLRF